MLFGEFAKCQAEAEYPELWNGLVGAWSPCLSPRGGTVLRDLSGRQNHGTLTNMDPATDWVTSGGKSALDFDGSNDYVDCGKILQLGSATSASILFWIVRPSATSIISCGLGAADKYRFGVVSNGTNSTLFAVVEGDVGYNYPNATVADTGLLHIALTFAPSTVSLFVNGKSVSLAGAGNPATLASTANQSSFFIGRNYASTIRYSTGTFLDVTCLSRTCTASDVSLAHRLGPGGWATPRRRRWNYATAQTAIPYWVFARKNARLIGGGVS